MLLWHQVLYSYFAWCIIGCLVLVDGVFFTGPVRIIDDVLKESAEVAEVAETKSIEDVGGEKEI